MADDENKATIRVLKQVDRDLLTARELLREGIKSGGEDVATVIIMGRIKAALTALETMGVVLPFAPTRDHDNGLLRVIRALEQSGIAVVGPDEHEDDAIERVLRKYVSPKLERMAASVRTEAEARTARSF